VVNALAIRNLIVSVEKKTILNDVSLEVNKGHVHALMGPNGSGKSSLAYTIMGHPRYVIQSGTITCFDHDIALLSPDQRAKRGLFLATQNPVEIEGISMRDFLRQAYNALYRDTAQHLTPKNFLAHLDEQLELLGIDANSIDRSVNVGFSGGEKKKSEMLQLAVLRPKIAILDEIDSGLDVDALKVVCSLLKTIKLHNHEMSFIVISHNPRIFDFLIPNVVHIMQNGAIALTGDPNLIETIESIGFQ
jgi:Fe-S cluster assembly ATP-binding protein